jgi:hypothetical protein
MFTLGEFLQLFAGRWVVFSPDGGKAEVKPGDDEMAGDTP